MNDEHIITSVVKKTVWQRLPGYYRFSKDVMSNDIKLPDAIKIVDAFEKGADNEHSVSRITHIDAWTCKKVLDIAYKYDLLNKE